MAPTLIQNLGRVGSGARRIFLHSFTYSLNNYVVGAITCQDAVLTTRDSEHLLGAYQWMGKTEGSLTTHYYVIMMSPAEYAGVINRAPWMCRREIVLGWSRAEMSEL